MKFLLPYYFSKRSVVHACPPDVKIAFVAVVLVACWLGVYGLPVGLSYGVLTALIVISVAGLTAATNLRGALRLFLLPGVVGVSWVVLYFVVESFHAWRHVTGAATDSLEGTLGWHVATRIAYDLRRVLALFCSAAAVALVIVSTSVSDLRRAWLVPTKAVMNIELFMSMFTRFQWRVRRILYGHHLVGYGVTPAGLVRRGPGNAFVLASRGLVVFVIAVLRDIPAIFNYRALKQRLGGPGGA